MPETAEAREISAEDAAQWIGPGDHVFVGTGCAAPKTLLAALERRKRPPPDATLWYFLTTGAYGDRTPDPATAYRHRTFFAGTDVQPLLANGRAEYVPMCLSEVPALIRTGRMRADVALVQVSQPDSRGYVSLGLSVDVTMTAIRHARRVVAEVNPHMPRTHGDSFVHVSALDALVYSEAPLGRFRHRAPDSVAEAIARYIGGVIEDGATLQIGPGHIPNAALRHLRDRADLGIHSDCLTDGLVQLVADGVVTGRRKTCNPEKVVASYGIGTEALFGLVDDNPFFQFSPVDVVCDPWLIASQDRMVAVNQAFAVDLTGQASVDQVDGIFYGGVATQPDFLRGAARARGGKPIVCLASTTPDGSASRIRPYLTAADGVGIARGDVHYVITEYGIAYLFGKSIGERALTLIEVAHPDFREDLLAEARSLGYVSTQQRSIAATAYPIEEERERSVKDGHEVRIRPAAPSDARRLQELFQSLSPQDVYTRFFGRLRRLSDAQAQDLCNVDHTADVAFVATVGPREAERVIASGCYFLNHATNLAETAFVVHPDWRGYGVGKAVQDCLSEHARDRGIRGFVAEVMASNQSMVRLAQNASQQVEVTSEEDALIVTSYF